MKKIKFNIEVLSANLRDKELFRAAGYLFNLMGHQFVAHKPTFYCDGRIEQSGSGWAVSHYGTGAKLCGDFATIAKAKQRAVEVLTRRFAEFENFLETAKIINT